MRYNLILLLTLLGPISVTAQDLPSGCFTRDYSDEHLARNPEQVVDRISILFSQGDGITNADVKVLLADQGHAGRAGFGGMRAGEVAGNYETPLRFGVECDGGAFDVITNDAQGLTVATDGFRLSDDSCSDGKIRSNLLEEGNSSTLYRLDRSDEAACDW